MNTSGLFVLDNFHMFSISLKGCALSTVFIGLLHFTNEEVWGYPPGQSFYNQLQYIKEILCIGKNDI